MAINKALAFLAHETELVERDAAIEGIGLIIAKQAHQKLNRKPVVKLRRTFNQPDGNGGMIKYWRVIAPATHRNYESDLSREGLIEWGIIC